MNIYVEGTKAVGLLVVLPPSREACLWAIDVPVFGLPVCSKTGEVFKNLDNPGKKVFKNLDF